MRMLVLLAVVSGLLAACTTTTINQEWKDPAYGGPGIGSVMVVGFPMNSPVGRGCTDEFVTELGTRGIPATRGYNALPERATKETALAKTKELGLEGLLVCRFLQRRSELDVSPTGPDPMLYNGPEFWPPYDYVENKYDVFGTMMYESSTGKPIWSAVSDTYVGKSDQKILHSYVKAMMKKMEKQRVIRVK